jgi:hypothetical protein
VEREYRKKGGGRGERIKRKRERKDREADHAISNIQYCIFFLLLKRQKNGFAQMR